MDLATPPITHFPLPFPVAAVLGLLRYPSLLPSYCDTPYPLLSTQTPPSALDFSLPPVRRGTHHLRPSPPRSCASSCSGVIAALAVMTDSTTLRTCTTLSTVFLATYHYYVFSFRRPLGNACRSFTPLLAPFYSRVNKSRYHFALARLPKESFATECSGG